MSILQIIKIIFITFVTLALVVGTPSLVVSSQHASKSQGSSNLREREAAVVLGAGVHGLRLSDALLTRMTAAITLYRDHKVKKILLTGDGTDFFYSETAAMRRYANTQNVPPEAILEDPHGFSTAASMKRASEVFFIKSAYVISQKFHLPRACWLGQSYGMDVEGLAAQGSLLDSRQNQIREFLATVKDFYFFHLDIGPSESRGDI